MGVTPVSALGIGSGKQDPWMVSRTKRRFHGERTLA